jgi:hypothetical protein
MQRSVAKATFIKILLGPFGLYFVIYEIYFKFSIMRFHKASEGGTYTLYPKFKTAAPKGRTKIEGWLKIIFEDNNWT